VSSYPYAVVEVSEAQFRLIVTDGVFSMDGVIADLAWICDLADAHDPRVDEGPTKGSSRPLSSPAGRSPPPGPSLISFSATRPPRIAHRIQPAQITHFRLLADRL